MVAHNTASESRSPRDLGSGLAHKEVHPMRRHTHSESRALANGGLSKNISGEANILQNITVLLTPGVFRSRNYFEKYEKRDSGQSGLP